MTKSLLGVTTPVEFEVTPKKSSVGEKTMTDRLLSRSMWRTIISAVVTSILVAFEVTPVR